MRIGIDDRWLWEFPGTPEELWGEWADGFAPLHLDPSWEGPEKEVLGTVTRVEALPDDLDGVLTLGRRPRLRVGSEEAPARRRPRRAPSEDGIFGPLAGRIYMCPHEVRDGRLVRLQLNRALRSKEVRTLLAHSCIRELEDLTLVRIDRLPLRGMVEALASGGPLPHLKRLSLPGDLDERMWSVLQPLLPALEELDAGELLFPPPPLDRVRATRVDKDPCPSGPRLLELRDDTLSSAAGWWQHVEELVLDRPLQAGDLRALAREPAPPRLSVLRCAMVDPAHVPVLLEAWPALQRIEGRSQLPPRPGVQPKRPPLDEAQVAEVERELGVPLPPEYRTFVTTRGDGGPAREGGFVSLLDPAARGDRGLLIYGYGSGLWSVLVLKGPHAGTVLYDARAEGGGIRPHIDVTGRRLRFDEWLSEG